jgi:hypothetical protein
MRKAILFTLSVWVIVAAGPAEAQLAESEDLSNAGNQVDAAGDQTKDTVDQTKDTVDQTKDQVEDTADQTKDQVEDTADQTKDQVEDTADQTKDQVEDTTDQTRDAARDAAGAVDEKTDSAKKKASRIAGRSGATDPEEKADDLSDLVAEGNRIGNQTRDDPAASRWQTSDPEGDGAGLLGLPITGKDLLLIVLLGGGLILAGWLLIRLRHRRAAQSLDRGALRGRS